MDNKKYETFQDFLKKNDINGLIENFEPDFLEKPFESDFIKPIHHACFHGCTEIVKFLIGHKCDIESENYMNQRPIHYASMNGKIEIVKLLIEHNCNIEAEDSFNCRPIHYATVHGHFEILRLLIEKKCDIECETNDKCRPIHYACFNNFEDIMKLLIDNKCNIESEDINKWRPIHFACYYGDERLVRILLAQNCHTQIFDKKNRLDCRDGITYKCPKDGRSISVRKGSFLEKANITCRDVVKLAYFWSHNTAQHTIEEWTKLSNHTVIDWSNFFRNVCKNFSKNPVKIFCIGHIVEIDESVVAKRKYNAGCERKEGRTPVYLSNAEGYGNIVKIIHEVEVTKKIRNSIVTDQEKSSENLSTSNDQHRLPFLEKSLNIKENKAFKLYMKRPIDTSEIYCMKVAMENDPKSENTQIWKEIMFYKSIRDHEENGFQLLCSADVINRQRKLIPCSFLEVAAEKGHFRLLRDILKKNIFNSETWEKAKKIALNKGYRNIYETISDMESLLKYKEKANFSILHSAVCNNDPDMLEFILSRDLVDPNNNHEVLGTALALSITLCHEKCTRILKDFNVNCNTQNKYHQSPLHEAICNGMIENCQYLIDCSQNIDQDGFMGLTPLHCAVIRGYEELCDQLIKRGADCSRYAEFLGYSFENLGDKLLTSRFPISNRENPLSLCLKINETIYPCFLEELDTKKANCCDSEGNSLLHLAVMLLDYKLCDVIMQAGGKVDFMNKKGFTPLSALLSQIDEEIFDNNPEKIIEIINLFTQSECDLNEHFIFQNVSRFNCERLLLALLPSQNRLLRIDENIIRIAINKKFWNFCEILLNSISKDFLKSYITDDIIQKVQSHNQLNLLKFLVINADAVVQQSVIEHVLYHLANLNAIDSFECLLNISVINPQCFDNGETLLTKLFKEKKFNFSQKVIESDMNCKKYINFKNHRNQTPLQVAIEAESIDSMQHLILETEDLDNEDNDGCTALTQLFEKISNNKDKSQHAEFLKAIRTIIINEKNIWNDKSMTEEMVKFSSRIRTKNDTEILPKNKENTFDVNEESFVKEEIIAVEKMTCAICLDREVDTVFDCGHTICEICSEKLIRCPFCYLEPVQPKRLYFS